MRVVGAVLTVLAGIPFVFFVWVSVSSRFEWGRADHHGYALIFGTFLALIAGLVLALVVPLIFARGRRSAAYGWSMLGYAAVAAGLILSLVTA